MIVCLDADNHPLPRISAENAEILRARGWARWIGTSTRRHLKLTEAAPLALLTSYRSSGGTRRDRADHSCKTYAEGQAFGSHLTVEHRPV